MAMLGRTLLVEGRDDREVIYQICNRFGIDNQSAFAVDVAEGFDNLREQLLALPDTELAVLGVVTVANSAPADRWRSISDALGTVGYVLPQQPEVAGTVCHQVGRPTVGLWLMPDNRAAGSLEDLLTALIPDADPLLARAVDCVSGIPAADRRFIEQDRTKAVLHTWLAWQEEPGTPLGLALTRDYLKAGTEPVPTFVTWLRRLFHLPAA